jgi:hypothetical protein
LPEAKHKDRAANFSEEISSTTDKAGLKQLISGQVQIFSGNNPYSLFEQINTKCKKDMQNKSVDRYHEIIHSWNK